MKYFPTFIANSAINMMEMGITPEIYNKLARVAQEEKCVIMIRRTNKGSVMPFVNKLGSGKKLPTKGKSSDAFFTTGSIPFFAQMAKRLDPDNWYEEQCALISILGETIKEKGDRALDPKYKYIPKMLTKKDVEELRKKAALSNSELEITDETESIVKVVVEDKIAGNVKIVEYKLVKTTWQDVNKEFNGNLVPPIDTIDDNTTLYRLYMKVTNGEGYPTSTFKIPQPALAESVTILDTNLVPETKATKATKATANTPATPAVPAVPAHYPSKWEHFLAHRLWQHFKDMPRELKQRDIINENAPALASDSNFREVRVLGLFTQGSVEVKDSTVTKRYYEVVADYDLFMIAPAIENFSCGPFEIPQTPTEEDLKQLEANWWINNPINPKFTTKSDVTAQREASSPPAKVKKQYGIFSKYELQVRRAINQALGIKAVQHGVETANLFHTSDLKDPVIAIFPGTQIPLPQPLNGMSQGPLFFLSFGMLIELMTGSREEMGEIKSPMEREVFNKDIWAGSTLGWKDSHPQSFYYDYAAILNLNWGTNAYYDFNFRKNDAYIKDKTKFIQDKESSYCDLLFSLIKPEDVLEFYQLFGFTWAANKFIVEISQFKEAKFPLSIKAFYVFLFRDYKRFTRTTNAAIGIAIIKIQMRFRARRAAALKGAQTAPIIVTSQDEAAAHQALKDAGKVIADIKERQNHYKFIKRLTFLSEFYKSVHVESENFGQLCHMKSSVPEIQNIYLMAIQGIQKVLLEYKKMKFKPQEAVPQPQQSQSTTASLPPLRPGSARPLAPKESGPVTATNPLNWDDLFTGILSDSEKLKEYEAVAPLTTLIPMPNPTPQRGGFLPPVLKHYSPFYSALKGYIDTNQRWIAKQSQPQPSHA